MRRFASAVYLILSFCLLSSRTSATPYTLYYVDATHNVSRITLDLHGKPIGTSVKLTNKGGYDGFSISPDEKRLVGFRITVMKRIRIPSWMIILSTAFSNSWENIHTDRR